MIVLQGELVKLALALGVGRGVVRRVVGDRAVHVNGCHASERVKDLEIVLPQS